MFSLCCLSQSSKHLCNFLFTLAVALKLYPINKALAKPGLNMNLLLKPEWKGVAQDRDLLVTYI